MIRTVTAATEQMREMLSERHGIDDLDALRRQHRLPAEQQTARWDCFRLLQARGWSLKRIAEYFGVDEVTVLYGVNPAFRQKRRAGVRKAVAKHRGST